MGTSLPESILGSCHSPPEVEQEGVKCAQKLKPPEEKKNLGRKINMV